MRKPPPSPPALTGRTLLGLCREAAPFHKGHPRGHLLFVQGDGRFLPMSVPHLGVLSSRRLAPMVAGIRRPCALTFSVEQDERAEAERVVVAVDLSTWRQAVVRSSDGKAVRCGKVAHDGVETLRAALGAGS